jgi:hypothetical protein
LLILLLLLLLLRLRADGGLVLDDLVDKDQELLKVDLIIFVGVVQLHSLGDVFGMELFANDTEERLELGSADGTVAILVEGVEALLEAGQFLLGEVVGGLDCNRKRTEELMVMGLG